MSSEKYAGRAQRVSRLVDILELTPRVRSLDDRHEREAVALADGLIDIAQAFETYLNDLLPRLEAEDSQVGVEDAIDEVVADLREVMWHVWYSKLLRADLLGPAQSLPWINQDLRP